MKIGLHFRIYISICVVVAAAATASPHFITDSPSRRISTHIESDELEEAGDGEEEEEEDEKLIRILEKIQPTTAAAAKW